MTGHRHDLPQSAQLFTDTYADRTIVLENISDLADMLHRLYEERGIVNLMLECGGNLLRQFLEKGLINEWVQIITPTLTGGTDSVLPGKISTC